MSVLEDLESNTRGLVETVTPFKSWAGSPVKDWEFTFQLLGVGDLADISKWISNASIFESALLKKIYVIAKSLTLINNKPIVTEEDVENYNSEHNLIGAQKLTVFQLKVIHIRKLNEAIINRLVNEYDLLEEKYLEKHLGDALYQALKSLSSVDTLNTADAIANAEQSVVEQTITEQASSESSENAPTDSTTS